ncbi:facilitated trehalose transporter Tret1-like [Chelonus insularis]|uniref:facilitated trehalose transporter Tret1-like n=1 Tax=Chelonus insularis TaxID=460826 RepID=UPI00158DAA46|nr:facilitated trehalose transporter Tret1-like [Chelonus insularis]
MTKIIVKSTELSSMSKLSLWPQWFTGLTISLGILTAGLSTGWTSPYLAQLTSPNVESPLMLTNSEASWVASLLNLGRFVGAIIGALTQGIIGRKRTLVVGGCPLAIGWICMIMAKSPFWLFVARFFSGIGGGMIWTTLSLYLGEIADPSIRGSLIFLCTNAAFIGGLLGNIMGSYLHLDQFGYISLSFIVLFQFILIFFIPESPYHHIANNDMERAKESLKWFKRQADIPKEIQALKDFIGSTKTDFSTRFREFCKPKNCKNTVIMCLFNIFLYFSGHNTIGYYAEIIVTKSGVNFAPGTVVIALSLCTVVAASTATIVVDKFGRKSLLIVSSLGTGCALTLLGCHFHFLSCGFDSHDLTWLPIFALFLFNCSISYGLVPVPNALIGELFPPILKTFASMLFSGSSALLSFITARTFQPLVDIMSEKYVFWMFALSAFSVTPFTYFCVVETKGQTLMEIQNKADEREK